MRGQRGTAQGWTGEGEGGRKLGNWEEEFSVWSLCVECQLVLVGGGGCT